MKDLWKKAVKLQKIEENNTFIDVIEKVQENENIEQNTIEDIGFNYIIKRQTFAPICFGSTAQRDSNPISGRGLSSFMARYMYEQFPKLSPNVYDLKGQNCLDKILNKKRSTKGLIGEEPRFRDPYKSIAPPSSKYNLSTFPKKTKRNKAAFSQSSDRFKVKPHDFPGPGNYNLPKKRKIPFCHKFGGSIAMQPAIPVECVSINVHVCEMCHLTPLIDFWHKNYTTFMCIQCYSEEFEEHNKYTTKQLREFSLMRDCSYMHDHQATDTYITTLPKNYTKKKCFLETYLSQYFDEFLPQPIHDLPVQLTNVTRPSAINFKEKTQFYAQFQQYLMQIAKRKTQKRKALDADESTDSSFDD